MVASLVAFNQALALVASLPALLLRLSQHLVGVFVSRAVSRAVPFSMALAADLGLAVVAPGTFFAFVAMDVFGWDPFAALSRRAVDTVAGGVLAIFLVPCLFELRVKQAINMFQGDVIFGATSGRHVLGVCDGEFEAPLEA